MIGIDLERLEGVHGAALHGEISRIEANVGSYLPQRDSNVRERARMGDGMASNEQRRELESD